MTTGETENRGTAGREGSRDAGEDLAMIRRLMEQSHGVVHGAAGHYLAWGALISAALVLTWAHARGTVGIGPAWIWPVTIGAGWITSMWLGWRQDRTAPVTTPGGRAMAAIWIGAGVAMTVVGFAGASSSAMEPSGMLGALSAVMGAAYFATAGLRDSRWPRLVAVGWWAGAAAILVWPGVHALLVMAGLMVVLHLVPGVVIYRATRSRTGGAPRGSAA